MVKLFYRERYMEASRFRVFLWIVVVPLYSLLSIFKSGFSLGLCSLCFLACKPF